MTKRTTRTAPGSKRTTKLVARARVEPELEVPQDIAEAAADIAEAMIAAGRLERATHANASPPALGLAPYTADIGDGPETFATLVDVQRAVWACVSGLQSGSDWYRRMRSKHGAKVRDARGRVVATVSYNSRLWATRGKREEIVLAVAPLFR